jgi:UDP-glucose 4-epimerase
MKGVNTVIHLAAMLHVIQPSPSLYEQYESINVGGTATVVEAAVQAGVQRVVLFSTITVYGDSSRQILTEDTPPHPDTYYAKTKLEAERIVLNAKRSDGQPLGTVLRLGAVYGPRIKGNYQRLLRSLARGRFIPIGDGCNRRTLIYDRDVARAAVLAAQHPTAAGKIEALGHTPPRISFPIGPVRWIVGILEDAGRMIGYLPPIGRATINKYTEDIAVSSQRIQAELGFRPQFNLGAGWRETVKEMRQIGDL